MADIRPPLRLLHCSDFHLHDRLRDGAREILRSLQEAITEHNPDAVLIAGDIFDSEDQSPEFVAEVAAGLRAFGRPMAAIRGNHDVVYRGRDALSELFGLLADDDAALLGNGRPEEHAFLDGRVRAWGRDMPEHSPANNPLAGFTGFLRADAWNIVMAHGELLDAPNYRSSPIILEAHPAVLATADYVALGHRHDARIVVHERSVVSYSGSAAPWGRHGTATLVDLDPATGVTAVTLAL